MQLNIIAAVAENRAIGYQNDVVYFIREDLKRHNGAYGHHGAPHFLFIT